KRFCSLIDFIVHYAIFHSITVVPTHKGSNQQRPFLTSEEEDIEIAAVERRLRQSPLLHRRLGCPGYHGRGLSNPGTSLARKSGVRPSRRTCPATSLSSLGPPPRSSTGLGTNATPASPSPTSNAGLGTRPSLGWWPPSTAQWRRREPSSNPSSCCRGRSPRR